MSDTIPVFDGHNDFLLRLLRNPANRETIWLRGDGTGHLDLPRMKAGGFAGGFFAIYIPSPQAHDSADFEAMMNNPPFDLPLPALIRHEQAQPVALAMAGHLLWMERAARGRFKVCRTVADLRSCHAEGIVSGIMHMEGAEAIGADLDALHLFHSLGLRSLGPVWSRPTVFGHGVPFRFPGTPDTGSGLTDAGRRLVAECNRLKIMLDLSHLNQKGFEDVAGLSDAPLVATHSNAHAVTPSTRNLTDRQLDAIRESRGMVGLNFATSFLREDGRQSPEMGWEPVLRHLDHLIGLLGEDHVGLGSDFDGATIPQGIGDVTGLPALQAALRAHGYDEALMRKLCHENWYAVLERTWGA
ncbi:dipeptidase [Cereibacter azotoformans]|uniref:Dipeptidase AC n=1 Tax=Cereibacter azotoformans TaxID=43057 RepID=A0A2T5KF26_9RHOB|nr:dipeptidase [Cereibacter azotoformans]AXQ92639.1 membrane dipeptidase [Cereibacter sphaeroides]MBO4169779.1 dipeptidase [Cereibacter azotoformans]PTR20962.1 dipeptidase AC [Cereibacter azotoformans]UIJ30916.1 dipeptidase [Cereibacter azotoformans]